MTKNDEAEVRLIGVWRTDPGDRDSLRAYGDVSLAFEKGGRLTYTVHLPSKKQIINLVYRVDGSWLVTDQPSSPREDRVEFFFAEDGRLVFKNPLPAQFAYYVRE